MECKKFMKGNCNECGDCFITEEIGSETSNHSSDVTRFGKCEALFFGVCPALDGALVCKDCECLKELVESAKLDEVRLKLPEEVRNSIVIWCEKMNTRDLITLGQVPWIKMDCKKLLYVYAFGNWYRLLNYDGEDGDWIQPDNRVDYDELPFLEDLPKDHVKRVYDKVLGINYPYLK